MFSCLVGQPHKSVTFFLTEGVIKLLNGQNPSNSKATGLDELHPGFLKELAVELGPGCLVVLVYHHVDHSKRN